MNPNTKKRWEKKYVRYIDERYIRSDGRHLLKFMHLLRKADAILDFGSGLGGNVQYLATHLENTRFLLIDHSETSQDFVRNELLGNEETSVPSATELPAETELNKQPTIANMRKSDPPKK